MKFLRLLGLVMLVGCGQSLDTVKFTDKNEEEHNTGTNYNKIKDIEDCLNGDREACKRAIEAGFTNAPFHFDDLSEANSITIDGYRFNYMSTGNGVVRFKKVYDIVNYGGGTYTARFKHIINVNSDNTIDIEAYFKYTFQAHYTLEDLQPGSSQLFRDSFQGFVNESGIEWYAHDRTHFYIAGISQAVEVK